MSIYVGWIDLVDWLFLTFWDVPMDRIVYAVEDVRCFCVNGEVRVFVGRSVSVQILGGVLYCVDGLWGWGPRFDVANTFAWHWGCGDNGEDCSEAGEGGEVDVHGVCGRDEVGCRRKWKKLFWARHSFVLR